MVDFRKKLKKGDIDKKTNPVEVYDTLDRRSITGPLRPAQKYILEKWFNGYTTNKDLIIKLHTGEGKTLIGLLILQSKLNIESKPCLFVCPNKYLVEQVSLEAKKFGIPYCVIPPDNQLPNDFLEGKKILITHVQKVFNGKSIFGVGNTSVEVGTIILDDSHACIDSIRNSFSIKLSKDHALYSELKSLFEEELKSQGEGSYLDIGTGSYDTLMTIPYWSWIDKKSKIIELISDHREETEILFAWPILKDCIEHCQAIITGSEIEISPYHVPIRSFGSFYKAGQRILMSATTQDDSFFIKGLGFSIDSVKQPLVFLDQKWSGEKMILLPSLIDEDIDRELVITKFAPPFERTYGIVAIVSSFKKAELYERQGSVVANSEDIFQKITKLKRGLLTQTLVIVNRYDGIDLPDESCRILIIDSMPYFNSLADRYEELCRSTGDIINIKIAQRIEQGLGRSVRGEKDYTVILLIGSDLVKFVKSVRTNKYFSGQTKMQIQIGLEIAEMAKNEVEPDRNSFSIVSSLIKQSLQRDEGWKEFYKEEMDKISSSETKNEIYNTLQIEKEAEEASFKEDYELACNRIQFLIDNYVSDINEKGWYLQLLARYKYQISKTESNQIQKSAFQSNLQLLKPKDGISYKRIEYINENRLKRIREWIEKHSTYDELMINVDSILDNFSFGVEAEKFEHALWDIGNILGFISQRPDKEFRKGPDNLWCGVDNKYFLFECKSEVSDSREEVNKNEAAQMNSHCGWFNSIYGEVPVKRILIIPTKTVSYYADFTHDVQIMRKGKLKEFKSNLKSFIKEFKPYNIHEISDEKLQVFLDTHKLTIDDLENQYSERYYKKN
jgi:replicative superfamily II helicase